MTRKTAVKKPSETSRRLKEAAAKDKRLLRDIHKGLDEEQRFGLTRLKDRRRSAKHARV